MDRIAYFFLLVTSTATAIVDCLPLPARIYITTIIIMMTISATVTDSDDIGILPPFLLNLYPGLFSLSAIITANIKVMTLIRLLIMMTGDNAACVDEGADDGRFWRRLYCSCCDRCCFVYFVCIGACVTWARLLLGNPLLFVQLSAWALLWWCWTSDAVGNSLWYDRIPGQGRPRGSAR